MVVKPRSLLLTEKDDIEKGTVRSIYSQGIMSEGGKRRSRRKQPEYRFWKTKRRGMLDPVASWVPWETDSERVC